MSTTKKQSKGQCVKWFQFDKYPNNEPCFVAEKTNFHPPANLCTCVGAWSATLYAYVLLMLWDDYSRMNIQESLADIVLIEHYRYVTT
jgi:hypothetical protein